MLRNTNGIKRIKSIFKTSGSRYNDALYQNFRKISPIWYNLSTTQQLFLIGNKLYKYACMCISVNSSCSVSQSFSNYEK